MVKRTRRKAFPRKFQIFEWLYEKRVTSFDDMSNLSKDLREKLKNQFAITTLKTVIKQTSQDGTIKFLFELHDGYTIETVLMRHEYGNSVCVTTQVGRRIGCTFCASTLGGLKRNLEAGEIVAQVLKVQSRHLTKQMRESARLSSWELANRLITLTKCLPSLKSSTMTTA